ncbi:O-antigen polymerase [Bacillus cereus]|uniref:O-antigen polymerase n=1 Tax=Bacillus cereus TaxID=1396 RepID=UPI001E529A4D|nr:O-antigen polymerase [Bacillus cereus]MCC2454001.1 oligosaccharide repeat unit polymerase [Bacillus cereus]
MYELMIIFTILVLLFIGRKTSKNWVNPAYLMTLYWSIFIVFALIAFRGRYEWDYRSILWILFACVIFGFGHTLGNSLSKKKYLGTTLNISSANVKKVLSKISWQFILLCIIIGLLRIILEVFKSGFSMAVFYDLNSLMDMNTDMAYQRYYGGGNESSPIMQIMLIFGYIAPLCGGYALLYAEKRMERILSFATFIPILSDVLVTNAKAGFIAAIFLWISGLLVAYLEIYKREPVIRAGMFIKLGFGILSALGLFYLSMLLRIGNMDESTREEVSNKFITYAFGHVPAFDYWFANNSMDSTYSLGKYTFIGLFSSLGLFTREQGIYTDAVYFSGGTLTNVYTAFRGMILDYGIVGSLLLIMTFGIVTGYFFGVLLKQNKNIILAKAFLAATYFFIMYSFIISIWTYVSYIMVFPAFIIYLWLANPKEKIVAN